LDDKLFDSLLHQFDQPSLEIRPENTILTKRVNKEDFDLYQPLHFRLRKKHPRKEKRGKKPLVFPDDGFISAKMNVYDSESEDSDNALTQDPYFSNENENPDYGAFPPQSLDLDMSDEEEDEPMHAREALDEDDDAETEGSTPGSLPFASPTFDSDLEDDDNGESSWKDGANREFWLSEEDLLNDLEPNIPQTKTQGVKPFAKEVYWTVMKDNQPPLINPIELSKKPKWGRLKSKKRY